MMERILISHASKDKEIIQAFMDEILIGALGIKITDIFCTSTDGTKIKSGSDWRNNIKEHLESSRITLLFLTPNYKESEICLNEMGAAWVLSGRAIPLFVEPLNYDSVGLLQEVKQLERLQDEKSLDRIKDILQELLEIPASELRSDRWTAKKSDFLNRLNKFLASNPFSIPMTRDAYEHLERTNYELTHRVEALFEENRQLLNLYNELKNAKDKAEVATIEKKHLNPEKYEVFKSLCKQVRDIVAGFPAIVNGVIYADYSGKDVSIDTYYSRSELGPAIAKDILKADPLEPNWYDTKQMGELHSALSDLSSFIHQNETDESFRLAYENEFEAPFSLSNLDFWTEVLDLRISFE